MDVPGYAVITGGGSGIGRACANAFAAEGCAGLALLDVNKQGLETVKAEIEASVKESQHASKDFSVDIYPLDITDENQVNTTIEQIITRFKRIDYVVNAAGIAIKHIGGAAYAKTDDWKRTLDINVNGTFYVLRACAKQMLTQEPILSSRTSKPLQRGSIVNFSSIQGVAGITLSTSYTTSKHAVIGLTRTASEDYAKDGLRINAICPGYTETPMTTKNPDVLKAMEERVGTAVPMQRMGRPDEIADGVLYLAGGRSSFVTGSVLMVDGGYTER